MLAISSNPNITGCAILEPEETQLTLKEHLLEVFLKELWFVLVISVILATAGTFVLRPHLEKERRQMKGEHLLHALFNDTKTALVHIRDLTFPKIFVFITLVFLCADLLNGMHGLGSRGIGHLLDYLEIH